MLVYHMMSIVVLILVYLYKVGAEFSSCNHKSYSHRIIIPLIH